MSKDRDLNFSEFNSLWKSKKKKNYQALFVLEIQAGATPSISLNTYLSISLTNKDRELIFLQFVDLNINKTKKKHLSIFTRVSQKAGKYSYLQEKKKRKN